MARLAPDDVRRLIRYDPATGKFFRLTDGNQGQRAGQEITAYDNGNGYLYMKLHGQNVGAHRAAWAIMKGCWPVEIDHRDTDKSNNIWSNLREATHEQNAYNRRKTKLNTSGFKGVGWHKCRQRWRAYIQHNERHISLGYYDTPEAAHEAYRRKSQELHGSFGRSE